MHKSLVQSLFALTTILGSWLQAEPDPSSAQSAESLFNLYCASCHGSDGRGGAGVPDLTDNFWKFGDSREDIERSIANGRSSVMPGLGAALGDQGLEQVVAYVLSLSGSAAVLQERSTPGRDMFAMFCASCHGEQGTGTQVIGALDLTDGVWLYGGRADDIRDVVTNGRASEMPAQREILSPDDISLLAKYVKNLSDAESNP